MIIKFPGVGRIMLEKSEGEKNKPYVKLRRIAITVVLGVAFKCKLRLNR